MKVLGDTILWILATLILQVSHLKAEFCFSPQNEIYIGLSELKLLNSLES